MGKKKSKFKVANFFNNKKLKKVKIASVAMFFIFIIIFFSVNIIISTNLEKGLKVGNYDISVKNVSSLLPLSIKLDTITVKGKGVDILIESIKSRGFLPIFIKSVKLSGISTDINLNLIRKEDSAKTPFNIKSLNNWFILTIPSLLSIGNIDLEYKKINLIDGDRKTALFNGIINISDFNFNKIEDFKLSIKNKTKKVKVSDKNLELTILNIEQTTNFSHKKTQNVKSTVKFSKLNGILGKNSFNIKNVSNILSLKYNTDTKEGNLTDNPTAGEIFVNGKKVMGGGFLKNISLNLFIKNLLNLGSKTTATINIFDKKFITLNGSKKDDKFFINGEFYKRDFNFSQPLLNTVNLIDDLDISLLKISTNNKKFTIKVSDSVLTVTNLNLTPTINGEIQLADELIVKEISPIVKINNLQLDYYNLNILGDIDVSGTIKAKYLKLGIFLENFKYKTKLSFDKSLIPNITSTAHINYKKNVINVKTFMKCKKKKFKGIKDFIENNKHGMNINYNLNLKSIFGSKIYKSIRNVEMAGNFSETYNKGNFIIKNSSNINNISILDTSINEKVNLITEGKVSILKNSKLIIKNLVSNINGKFFNSKSKISKFEFKNNEFIASGNSKITINLDNPVIKKKTILMVI